MVQIVCLSLSLPLFEEGSITLALKRRGVFSRKGNHLFVFLFCDYFVFALEKMYFNF